MFALSFTALFLELMVIRWVPSVVHLIAFYANLMLLSSFLGLGVGAVVGEAKRLLLGLFPSFLALDIGILVLSRHVVFGTSAGEARLSSPNPTVLNTLVLITIFVANTLLFVPLGQKIGTNLIGAMAGGFCEYLAMSVGRHRLSLLVIVAYIGSMLTLLVARRVRSVA